jgi:hypothetical protein
VASSWLWRVRKALRVAVLRALEPVEERTQEVVAGGFVLF